MAAADKATASSTEPKEPVAASAPDLPPDLTEAEKSVFEALKRLEMEPGPDAPLSPPHDGDNLEQSSSKDMSDIAALLQAAGGNSATRAESPPSKRARVST